MIDSHCHLADKQFAVDIDAVIERAVTAGVTQMVTVADSIDESDKCLALAEKYEQIFCSVGVHPHNATAWENPDVLRSLVKVSRQVVAIGEIGLDYHYDFSPRDTQRRVFQEQLELARELKMPVVVHCREAVQDVWQTVDAVRPEKLVMHCCTERWEDVRRFVERGYLLSFTGIATYQKSVEVRRTIQMCPLERMMVETDAPYLAPVPYRGKRNEPAYVVEVAKCMAKVKGVSLEEVDRVTMENTVGFFGLPS